MRYLLDTHVVYWWMTKSARLSKATISLISRESCSVSVASLWEMQLKQAAGKLVLPAESLNDELSAEGFAILPVSAAHIERAREFDGLKGDPFDLLLVAVADVEKMTFLTKDRRLLSLGFKFVKEA